MPFVNVTLVEGLHRKAGMRHGYQVYRRDGRLRADAAGSRLHLLSLMAILGSHPFATNWCAIMPSRTRRCDHEYDSRCPVRASSASN